MSVLATEGLGLALGGRAILAGVDADFQSGEITAIVGPNGAGKSSLLTCLAGLRRPTAGSVRLAGEDLRRLRPRERARRLGFLPQTAEIAWAVDVETLVGLGRLPRERGFGPGERDHAAVSRALAATGLSGMPRRDVTTLSGGERARVLMARLLAGEPEWLLTDEPLAGMDPGHQLDALALLRACAEEGRGVIITLHDLALAARCADRVVVLAHGAVIADGPPRAALSADILARAYGVTARWTEGEAGPLLDITGRASRGAGA